VTKPPSDSSNKHSIVFDIFCQLGVISINNERLPHLREKASKLPLEPGVYIMRDGAGKIIYIGKAKELRVRVSGYFRAVEKHDEKTWRMVSLANDFDSIVTANEFEALVLEASMIKQHKPKYNILLKDDKGWHYIRVGGGDWPRITFEMQRPPGADRDDSGARWLGPYTSAFLLRHTVEEVNASFALPTCRRRFPQEIGKGRPCLNFHIKQCMGVCSGRVNSDDYAETIREAVRYITEGQQASVDKLTLMMEEAAESLDFERAARLRDRIKAIRHRMQRQNVVFNRAENQDVLGLAQTPDDVCVTLLKFREQKLVDKQDHMIGNIANIGDLAAVRREFIISYYNSGQEIPRQVSIDGECEDKELVERFLAEKAGRKVSVLKPERGERLKLVDMARQNAAQTLSQLSQAVSGRTGRELAALDELARLLNLPAPPQYIELYDISNMGEETAVGAMVVFENARPLKSAYKKFNIKTVAGTDDYASMREVVSRRLERGESFGRLPDLILLDGGKGHVSAVAPILSEMGLSIPLYGLVKDQKHRTRAIATDGAEISVAATRSAFTLLSKMQDEVHRFAVTMMRKKHKKSAFESALTGAAGIGETRMRLLLTHFRTQAALKSASVDELAAVKGMTRPAAESLHAFLHPE
jgi:excinuclease ABC subunit C